MTYDLACVEGELVDVERTLKAGAPLEAALRIERVRAPATDALRASTAGYSADELTRLGVRSVLFGEPLPSDVAGLGFLTDTGIDREALRVAFDVPEESVGAIARLVVAEGLVGYQCGTSNVYEPSSCKGSWWLEGNYFLKAPAGYRIKSKPSICWWNQYPISVWCHWRRTINVR